MTTFTGIMRFFAGVAVSIVMAAIEILMLPIDYRRGRVFHALARFWARAILVLCGVRVRVRGLEMIDLSQSYVFVSNHASMLDIPCILAGIPHQIRIVYKKELEVIPVFGWGLKWGSYISIERGHSAKAMKSLEEAAQKIRNGASVLLYAEGTRTQDGALQPFKRGAFNLALRAGVPVIPLTVNGSYHLLRKRSIVIQPGTVDLILGAPIPVQGEMGKEAELRLMDQVRAAIEKKYVNQS